MNDLKIVLVTEVLFLFFYPTEHAPSESSFAAGERMCETVKVVFSYDIFNFIMKMEFIRHRCMKIVCSLSRRPSAYTCKRVHFCRQPITVFIDKVLTSIGVCAASSSPYFLAW